MNLDGLPSHIPDRRKAIALRSPCFAQAQGGLPWPPVRRMRLTLGGCGENFLRFRPRRFGSCLAAVQPGHPCPVVRRRAAHPASRRKPVIYHPWQIPLGACASPLFSTLRHMTRESVLSTTATPALSPCFASPLQCPRALRPRAMNVGGIHRPVKNGIQKKGPKGPLKY
jgi:hypothetical protein